VFTATLVHYTTSCKIQSSVPEDGLNYHPKHVEPIQIINKLLLLHVVGCLYYCSCPTVYCRKAVFTPMQKLWNLRVYVLLTVSLNTMLFRTFFHKN